MLTLQNLARHFEYQMALDFIKYFLSEKEIRNL